MAEDAGEKSHDPTVHRRQQAREQGQVAQSQDLAAALLLLGSLLILMFNGTSLIEFFGSLLVNQLGGDAWLSANRDFAVLQWTTTTRGLAIIMGPLLGLVLLAAVVSHLIQVGFLFVPSKLNPDFSNLSPLKGLKRIFSISGTMRLGFGIFKVAVVGAVAVLAIYSQLDGIIATAELEIPEIAVFVWNLCLWTSLKIGLALLVLGVLDYGYQWWRHERDLKMTSQEVREEMRNLQGDPQTASRRKQVQRQIAMQRASGSLADADVVITNPAELAVAIRYDLNTMNAPVVVAKGAGAGAKQIHQLAMENGIPIVEKKPLAQALFKDVDLNRPINNQLYAGVAEVLAYAFQLKGKRVPKA